MARKYTIGLPSLDNLMNVIDGAKSYFIVREACKLELFDEVEKCPRPVSVTALASVKGWETDALRRLMDSVVSLKLLAKSIDGQTGQDVYENTDGGRLLIAHGEPNIFEYAVMAKDDLDSIGNLADIIKKGPQPEPPAEGGSSSGYEGDMPREFMIKMHRMLEGTARPYADKIVTAIDLSRHKSAVDLGGGTGVYSLALLKAYPDMKVTLFEMPNAIPYVKEFYIPDGTDPRITLVGGDFMKDPIPRSDLFFVSNVLHGFEPEQCREVLRLLHASLNKGGAVLLVEQLLNDRKDGPTFIHGWDLAFFAYGGGRMYSGNEYSAMLTDTGFGEVQIVGVHETWACGIVYAVKK